MKRVMISGLFRYKVREPDGRTVARGWFRNGVTTVGLNDMLTTYFGGGAQKTVWYMGLIDSNGFVALAATDTMAQHAGWQELQTYSGNRQQWIPVPPAGGLTINSVPVVFQASSAMLVRGGFIVSDATKGSANGILYATGLTQQVLNVGAGQNVQLSYSPILQMTN